MIIIPDKLRRPAEVERDELRKQLTDAQAEIERKDKLIEQMRDALSWQCAGCPEVDDNGDRRNCDECSVKRLLSAAERGE